MHPKEKMGEAMANAINAAHTPNYYEDMGRAHDYLMRCKDCQHLVTFVTIQKMGMCDYCGNKRFTEITLLRQEEWDALNNGDIDFPDKELFLKEFAGVE